MNEKVVKDNDVDFDDEHARLTESTEEERLIREKVYKMPLDVLLDFSETAEEYYEDE